MEYFKKIQLNKWRQFENIDIEFDADISVLTGPKWIWKNYSS